ncbi:MAG: hypothetical protein B7Y75_02875 [Azorhizobium sp. 35-67-5]|nr:MAG: hypothetical protein B7Y75_02875 [Azorhizobium sp. 35-67-5]
MIEGLGVIETVESDNVLRWDGKMVYVEQDIFHNGQLVHSRYKRRVTKDVARALLASITASNS